MKSIALKKVLIAGIFIVCIPLVLCACTNTEFATEEVVPSPSTLPAETMLSAPTPSLTLPPEPMIAFTPIPTPTPTLVPTPEPTPETIWRSLKREGEMKVKRQEPDYKYRLDLNGDGENETLIVENIFNEPWVDEDEDCAKIKVVDGKASYTWKTDSRYSIDTFDIIDLDPSDNYVEILLHCEFTVGNYERTYLLRYDGTQLQHTKCNGYVKKLLLWKQMVSIITEI